MYFLHVSLWFSVELFTELQLLFWNGIWQNSLREVNGLQVSLTIRGGHILKKLQLTKTKAGIQGRYLSFHMQSSPVCLSENSQKSTNSEGHLYLSNGKLLKRKLKADVLLILLISLNHRQNLNKPMANFTNILRGAFAPISFCQKVTNPNCKRIKAAQNTFVQKSCS